MGVQKPQRDENISYQRAHLSCARHVFLLIYRVQDTIQDRVTYVPPAGACWSRYVPNFAVLFQRIGGVTAQIFTCGS